MSSIGRSQSCDPSILNFEACSVALLGVNPHLCTRRQTAAVAYLVFISAR